MKFSKNHQKKDDIPTEWQKQATQKDEIEFTCTSCGNNYKYHLGLFKKHEEKHIDDIVRTGAKISPGDDKMLSFLIAAVAYFFTHRAIHGSDTPLYEGIIPPVVVGVLAFSIGPVIGTLLRGLFGKKIPIYKFECPECNTMTFIASDGIDTYFPKVKVPGKKE